MTDKTNIFQALIKREPDFLARPLADLLPMRFMGEVAVNAYRGLLKHLDSLPLSLEEKESRLRDGQDAGKALLMIEAKIGELAAKTPQIQAPIVRGRRPPSGEPMKHERLGMTRKQMQRAEAIHTHPAEVAEVIREAEENEDIPTKTAVLNKIAYKQELARKKNGRETTQFEMKGEAFLYLTKLQQALAFIPAAPPKDLLERDFITIKALALLIIKRLEVFQNGKKDESSASPSHRLS